MKRAHTIPVFRCRRLAWICQNSPNGLVWTFPGLRWMNALPNSEGPQRMIWRLLRSIQSQQY